MEVSTIDAAMESTGEFAPGLAGGITHATTNGLVIVNSNADSFRRFSQVFVSLVEVDAHSVPQIGAARLTVHNIQPYFQGARVLINVEWNSPLIIQISWLWRTGGITG
ncbi:hypothetical protein [Thermomonospora umbrina]|uniref:Uncharacterized protein n=1 Tax=Thermomonospora umbrina TaxID=111806 RepID=A0A3D9SXP6_9ACTN|nr:hypothetical protein [Thermomonospora umbrina]REF00727.1 hypothetical protein DFJ69_6301 [Thermomonospora umbrina]